MNLIPLLLMKNWTVWILYTLFSLFSCDADPAALSKYVVALLRKEKPKAALKELCIDQLEVFLAKGVSKLSFKMIIRV